MTTYSIGMTVCHSNHCFHPQPERRQLRRFTVKVLEFFLIALAVLLAGCRIDATTEQVSRLPASAPMAEQNAELSKRVAQLVSKRRALQDSQRQTRSLTAALESDFKDARATLEKIGHSEGLGPLMIQHRHALPPVSFYLRRTERRKQQIVSVSLLHFGFVRELRMYANPKNDVESLPALETSKQLQDLNGALSQPGLQRRELLAQAVDGSQSYRVLLGEVDRDERKLVDTVQAYRQFLNKHLWWLRASEPTRLTDLTQLIENGRTWFAQVEVSDLSEPLVRSIAQSLMFWLVLLPAMLLAFKRRTLITAIHDIGARTGRPVTDRFSYTFNTLLLTMLIPLPLSAVMGVVGWLLQSSSVQSETIQALGYALVRVAILMYSLRVLRQMGCEGGLAQVHLRWPPQSVRLLRNALGWLIVLQMPGAMLAWFGYALDPNATEGLLTRLGVMIFLVVLSGFTLRVLNPRNGVFAEHLSKMKSRLMPVSYLIVFLLMTVLPLVLVADIFGGYVHAAVSVLQMYLATLWMIVGLVLLYSLAKRWLLLTRRQLAYQAALQRHRDRLAELHAAHEGAIENASAEFEVDEAEVNLAALSDSSLGLVTITCILVFLFGLYMIWVPVLPALGVFGDWQLWTQRVTIDGQSHEMTTTLGDLGSALVYAFGTAVLVNRVPAVLEIVLLRRARFSDGDRYTITKLTTYAIVAIGFILVLQALGAQWSQLQWLVAALGVGIGFGLQEIVANFISGLIILFERPVRVGDIVTVGDTSGVVTKIRIRATTIRDWNRKELLVPNKDLVTGRVLNWSLTDSTTRIVIELGVAYDTDIAQALGLMEQAALDHEHVLKKPSPLLSFDHFGDNALQLTLRVYVGQIDHRIPTKTELRTAIGKKFHDAGITIAFPQRDLHIDSKMPLQVSINSGHA